MINISRKYSNFCRSSSSEHEGSGNVVDANENVFHLQTVEESWVNSLVDMSTNMQTELSERLQQPQTASTTRLPELFHRINIDDRSPSTVSACTSISTTISGIGSGARVASLRHESVSDTFAASQNATRRLQQTLHRHSTEIITSSCANSASSATPLMSSSNSRLAPAFEVEQLIREATEQQKVCLDEIARLRGMLEWF